MLHPFDHAVDRHKENVLVLGGDLFDELEQALSLTLLLDPILTKVQGEGCLISLVKTLEIGHKQMENFIFAWRVVHTAIRVEEQTSGSSCTFP